MSGPLEGLRVLDLTRGPAGGVATMALADFGADVLRIVPPAGDPFEHAPAAPMWLRGKACLTHDLKTPDGVTALHELAGDADVLVTSFRPGVAERLRADWATLSAINPALVYCSITGFGPCGPYRDYKGYEALVAAKSGRMMTFAGQIPREGPVYAAVQVGTHVAAQAAVQGILAALLVRETTGRGQLVQTSLLQGMLPFDFQGLVLQQLMRKLPRQFPSDPTAALAGQPTLQYQPVLTKNGRWLQLGNLMEHLFHSYIAAAGLAHIYADPRFVTAPNLPEADREALRLVMLERMREQTADEWMAIFIADGNVAAEPIVSAQEALGHPQLIHNGGVVEVNHPRLGRMKQLGPVATLTATPGEVGNREPGTGNRPWVARYRDGSSSVGGSPAPLPAQVSAAPAGSRLPAPAPRAPRHPLEGVTVVEFATIIAAPYGCSLLADLGARVIKVEPPEGDGLRNLGAGIGATKTTAGKESICVDLKSEQGRKIARELIERADILIHNYRPGVPERLGIGYEQARVYNPRIVYVAATGYGSDGPSAHRPSAHPIAGAAMGGALYQAGAGMPPAPEPDGVMAIREYARRFMRANELNPDPNTSVVIATAALLGLWAQRTRGIGQYIQTDMMTANAWANLDDFLAYEGKPPRPSPDPDLYGLHALYRLYRCAPDAPTDSRPGAGDGWVFLACPFEHEWRALCRVLGRADLPADPRFADAAARCAHDADLAAALAEIFSQRTADAWEALLTAHDIGCVRADGAPAGIFWDRDEHVRQGGFVRETDHLRWGTYWRHGPLVTFSATPECAGPGVLAGQHTRQLLRELGYAAEAIAALHAAGVIAWEAP